MTCNLKGISKEIKTYQSMLSDVHSSLHSVELLPNS